MRSDWLPVGAAQFFLSRAGGGAMVGGVSPSGDGFFDGGAQHTQTRHRTQRTCTRPCIAGHWVTNGVTLFSMCVHTPTPAAMARANARLGPARACPGARPPRRGAACASQRTGWRDQCSRTHPVPAARRRPGAAPSPGASMALVLNGDCARGEGGRGGSRNNARGGQADCWSGPHQSGGAAARRRRSGSGAAAERRRSGGAAARRRGGGAAARREL